MCIRRLRCRLENGGVAASESTHGHPSNNRERKVPRGDHSSHAPALVEVLIVLAGHIAHRPRFRQPLSFGRVVAQVIDRLADIAVRLVPGLGALEDHRGGKVETAPLDEVRRSIENFRALVGGYFAPLKKRFLGRRHGHIDVFWSRLRNMAHDRRWLCWTVDFARRPVRNAPIADEERVGCSEPPAGAREGGAHPLP